MPVTHGSQEEFERFCGALRRMTEIPDAEWSAVQPMLSVRAFDRHAHLVRAGEPAPEFHYILSGLVRFYYSTEAGKEFNKHFAFEGGFAGSFHALIRGEAPGFSIQALEPTRTIALPNRVLIEAEARHPCWGRIRRGMAEWLLLVKEAREREMLLDPLEVRYRRFLQELPGLEDRIPQYHIASYLGVTNVALSRIRRKLRD